MSVQMTEVIPLPDSETSTAAILTENRERDFLQTDVSLPLEPPKKLPLRRSNRGKSRSDKVVKVDGSLQSCVSAAIEYKPADFVYFKDVDLDFYAIGLIDEIKLSRRDKCTVIVRYFWRTFQVPASCKREVLDREMADKGDFRILSRELFITDLQASIAPSLLRGKCSVCQFPELASALDSFDATVEDSFYYVYAFNPKLIRLISIRSKIKIGPDYQVTKLPVYRGVHPEAHPVLQRLQETQNTVETKKLLKLWKRPNHCLDSPNSSTSLCERVRASLVHVGPPKRWEELIWRPDGLEASLPLSEEAGGKNVRSEFTDHRLKMYLDAVRSLVAMLAFGGSDDNLVSAENGHVVANLAATTQHAYDTLHACGYDISSALEVIRCNPIASHNTPQHWTVKQARRLCAAIRVHGRNFHAIQGDYFSHRTAVDPIGGVDEAAATSLRFARRRKRRGRQAQTGSEHSTDACKVEGDLINKAKKPKCHGAAMEDEGTEDAKDAAEEGRRPRTLFQPTHEKSVKQLVEFYYYWKRKSSSGILSAIAHAAAASDAAAKFKKGKAAIIAVSDPSTSTNQHAESANDETGTDTPTSDATASPTCLAVPDDEETGVVSDKLTETSRLCHNCAVEPVELPPSKIQKLRHQRPSVENVCTKCRMHWRKYAELPSGPADEASTNEGRQMTPATVAQKHNCVSSVQDCRRGTGPDSAGSGEKATTVELAHDSAGSFCDVYSPTYASCWPSPLLKFESASPVPLEQCLTAITLDSVCVGEASEVEDLVKAQEGVVSRPCSEVIHISQTSTLRRVWDRSTSACTGILEYSGSCARTDVEFVSVRSESQTTLRPDDKKMLQLSMDQDLSKTWQQPQMQPMELTTKARELPVSVNLPLNDPKPLAAVVERPMHQRGIGTAHEGPSSTTHARGTFYPPAAVPPSSIPRQLHHIAGASMQPTGGVGTDRCIASTGMDFRPVMPSGGSLGEQNPYPSPSSASVHSNRHLTAPDAISSETAHINSFVKDQFFASSVARSTNFQHLQHQHHHQPSRLQQQQQQQQHQSSVSGSTIQAETARKVNQMFASCTSSLSGPQTDEQPQHHTRDAAAATTFPPLPSLTETDNPDFLRRYHLAYLHLQQQQQWEQQVIQFRSFLQAATPQQQQQLMMLLIQRFQQQQQQQSTTTTNLLPQPTSVFQHPSYRPVQPPSLSECQLPSSTNLWSSSSVAVTASTSPSSSVSSLTASLFQPNALAFTSQHQSQPQPQPPPPWSSQYYLNYYLNPSTSPPPPPPPPPKYQTAQTQMLQLSNLFDFAATQNSFTPSTSAAATSVEATHLRHQLQQPSAYQHLGVVAGGGSRQLPASPQLPTSAMAFHDSESFRELIRLIGQHQPLIPDPSHHHHHQRHHHEKHH